MFFIHGFRYTIWYIWILQMEAKRDTFNNKIYREVPFCYVAKKSISTYSKGRRTSHILMLSRAYWNVVVLIQQKRGVTDRELLPYFPYRDDGEEILVVIENMVEEYVNL